MSVRHQIPCYADGRSYSGLHTKHSDSARPYDCRHDQVISLTSPGLAWTRFWQIVSNELQRHSYAVHCIEADHSIRAVQEALGHESIDTTMLYEGCILPKDAVSPIGALREHQAEQSNSPERKLPNEDLFARPLSIDALELPFQNESTGGLASSFYRLLKTHIFGRFLCSRRSTIRAG